MPMYLSLAFAGALCLLVAGNGLCDGVQPGCTAGIDATNGVPRLIVDGQPTLPIVFFHNTDIPGEKSDGYLRKQVALARDAGVHIYSLPLRTPRNPDGLTPNWAYTDSLMDKFLAVDPQAKFILRVYPGPNWSWKKIREKTIPEGEFVRFVDGDSPGLSIASEWFRRGSNEELAQLVRHCEDSAYSPHIIAWQPGGPYHEMFLAGYRRYGPDYSRANTRAFRKWLRHRYVDDAALRRAWGGADVTLKTAQVPPFEPGRFPMRMGAGGTPASIFYDLPREQSWVDFSEYMSDITADRLLEWARIAKEESDHRKLVAFFYGYTFDLPGSSSGHYRLQRVLNCPDIDVLASPYSYADRGPGGAGNFMCPVDSIIAHGKLWFNEDDTRTSVSDLKDSPAKLNLWDELLADIDEDLGVLDRNFGAILTHRAATWWMDLIAGGQFQHPDMWRMLRERMKLYAEVYGDPQPFRPDAAVIVDEDSKLVVKDDWDANYWLMYRLRDDIAKSGASVGYYALADFINGTVPECKAYVFANAFRVNDGQVAAMRSRLDQEQSTAIWIYAPGYIGNSGADVSGVHALTGIRVEADAGKLGSEGEGLLAGERWGSPLTLSPRLTVTDAEAAVLSRYRETGKPSAAHVRDGSRGSILLADMGPSPTALRKLLESAGCHIWTRGNEVVRTDGRLLCVHSGPGGEVPIHLPPNSLIEAIEGEIGAISSDAVSAVFKPGETRWFRVSAGP